MRFLFLILPPSRLRPASVPPPSCRLRHLRPLFVCHTPSFTHNFVTHQLSHTTLSHTIFHTPSFTPNFVAQSVTPFFVTHHLSHTALSHTIFLTQLCHTPSFTHNFVTHNFVTHNFVTHTHTLFPSHSTLSHRIFHAPSFTHNFVTHHLSHTTWPHTCTLRGRRGTIVRHGRRTCRGRRGTYDTGLAPVALGRRW